jgi:hypothetical protein
MSRPSKLTPERRATILEALRNGATRSAVAAVAGVHRDTFYDWLKASPTFSTEVHAAEGEAEQALARVIMTAASIDGDWRAAEALLKRRFPDDWGDRVTHDVDGDIARIMEALAAGKEVAAPGGAAG